MKKPKVFLDTSILMAAVLSSRGGSFYILANLYDTYELFINDYVLQEALAAIDKKFAASAFLKNTLFSLLVISRTKIVTNPPKSSLKKWTRIINQKDAPILAAAIKHCRYLVTLDKHFAEKAAKLFALKKGLEVITPRELVFLSRKN